MRLKTTEVAEVRRDMMAMQGGRCALCGQPLGTKAPLDPVLDHDHHTGAIRGVLHRGCNSLLGKVENGAARYGVRNLLLFGAGLSTYLRVNLTNTSGLLHPSFKTETEKRELRNKRARIARAKRKEIN